MEVAHLARLEHLALALAQLEVAHLVHGEDVVGVRPEGHLHAGAQRAVHHPDAGDRAAIAVVVVVEHQRAERRLGVAPGRGHAGHDRLEQLRHAGAFLGRHRQDLLPAGADQLHDLLRALLRLGARQVDLVEHRDDLEPGIHGQEEVAQRLRLDALRRVDHQDRALARIERA